MHLLPLDAYALISLWKPSHRHWQPSMITRLLLFRFYPTIFYPTHLLIVVSKYCQCAIAGASHTDSFLYEVFGSTLYLFKVNDWRPNSLSIGMIINSLFKSFWEIKSQI